MMLLSWLCVPLICRADPVIFWGDNIHRQTNMPANLTLEAGAPSSKTVIADWDDARRADNYRLHAVIKADGKEVVNEIAQDSQFSLVLDKVAAGAVVVLTVSARNSAGESSTSDPVEIQVP
jgi:hypothetical protein